MKKKVLVSVIAVSLVLCCAMGGTLAWLTDRASVENIFTVGNIDIDLVETTGSEYKIIPGCDIAKDPVVTVKANSVDCWLFVKIDEGSWPEFKETDSEKRKVDYALANEWLALDSEKYPGVYYRKVNASGNEQQFAVLAEDKVTVSKNLTKEELLKVTTKPTLTVTAYAVQYYNGENASGERTHFGPAEAWAEVFR